MRTITPTLHPLILLIALSVIIPYTQARYLWNPNEQPQSTVHEASVHDSTSPMKNEHHILNLAGAPQPALQNSESSTKSEETHSKKDHSSTIIVAIQPTHSTSVDSKSSSSNKPPLSKEIKPLAVTTHSTPTQPAALPKGPSPSVASDASAATPVASVSSSNSITPTSFLSSSSSSPSLPSSSTSSSNDKNGTSSGAVAGIVISIIAIIGAIAAFVMIRKKKQTKRDLSPDPFAMGFGSHDPPPPPTIYPNHDPSSSPTTTTTTTTTYPNHDPSLSTYPSNPYNENVMTQTYYQDPQTVYMSPIPPPPQQQHQQQHQQYQLPPPQGSLGVFNVVSTFAPTLSDEIDIQMGDQIELLVEYDDGWCQGINLTRGNAKGVFPRHCVEHYPGAELGHMNRVSSMYMTH